MSDKLRAAALMAVDALDSDDPTINLQRAAMNLRAALAEPAQERMHPEIKKMYEDYFDKCFRESSAQQRPWVGLTAEDINQFETWFDDEEERKGWVDPALIAKYFEAKIKEKNT
jgi:hypothetical protein